MSMAQSILMSGAFRKRPFGVEHPHHLGLGCARFTVNDKWAIALQILLQCQVGGGERLGNAIETVKESIYCLLAIRVGDAVFFQRMNSRLFSIVTTWRRAPSI